MTTDADKSTTFNINGSEVRIFEANSAGGAIAVDGAVVTIDSDVSWTDFCKRVHHFLTLMIEAFSEIAVDEVILDYGFASLELIERVENLQRAKVPVSIVDIYEYLTPCAIAVHCAYRQTKEDHDESR